MLARELLSKPDAFLVAQDGEREYVVENIRRIGTYANPDDKTMYISLQLKECNGENIKR